VTDALSGQVQGVIGTVLLLIDHVRSGALRALAVTGETRSKLLPDIPAAAEFVPGFVATQWIGVGAPRETPAPIVDTLNREINAALGDARMQERITGLGGTIVASSPAEFTRFIAAETRKWARVVKVANGKSQ
jgi:tripartite-type tricarboxylate transporter receptor subunit TctC